MDIRKYFSPPDNKNVKSKLKKKKKGIVFDSDDEDEAPIKPITTKVKKRLSENRKEDKCIEITPNNFFKDKKVKKEKHLPKRKISADFEKPSPKKRKASVSKKELKYIDNDLDFDGNLDNEIIEINDDEDEFQQPKKIKSDINKSKQKNGKESLSEDLVCDLVSKKSQKSETSRDGKNNSKYFSNSSKLEADANKNAPRKTTVNEISKDNFENTKQKQKVTQQECLKAGKTETKKEATPQKNKTKKNHKDKKVSDQQKSSTKLKKVESPSNELCKSTTDMDSSLNTSKVYKSEKQEKFLKYQMWKGRAGPKAPGSKEIPQGADNCLEGMTFVVTGVLDSLDRDEAKSLIERYAGKVTGSVSGKTTYLVVGEDPGESKLQKAKKMKVKEIDEDGLLELIKTKPGKKSKYEIAIEKEAKVKNEGLKKKSMIKENLKQEETVKSHPNGNDEVNNASDMMFVDRYKPKTIKQIIGQQGPKSNASKLLKWLTDWDKNVLQSTTKVKPKASGWGGGDPTGAGLRAALLSGPPGVGKTTTASIVCKEAGFTFIELNASDTRSKRTLKEEVAQTAGNTSLDNMFGKHCKTGNPSRVPDALSWGKVPGQWAEMPELNSTLLLQPSGLKAKMLLLSFPEHMLLQISRSIVMPCCCSSVQHNGAHSGRARTGKHAILMDEVDGMSGNEDRGGMQELVQIIKQTKIPIICMCNDRTSPKMRTLTNYCFDLRFYRPRVEQITGAMMSICFKEGIKIQASAIQSLIGGCNQDIRQVLHNLSMLKANKESANVSYDDAKQYAQNSKKDVELGIFDIARKMLTMESASLSINEKTNLFFMDYSMIPLFVHENYPHITPQSAKGNIFKTLDALQKTSNLIAQGDLIDAKIRTDQSWSALPTFGLLSSVLPCDVMRGHMGGMINFPSFFGKLSTTGKNRRLIQELKFHSCIATGGTTEQNFISDYLTYLRWHLTQPLLEQTQTGELCLTKTTSLLDSYDLTREDFDSTLEVGQFPGRFVPMSKVDTKVKSAFTRTYNKESHMTPYAVLSSAVSKKKRKAAGIVDEYNENESQENEDDKEENDLTLDGMVKAKAPKKQTGKKETTKTKSKKKQSTSRKK